MSQRSGCRWGTHPEFAGLYETFLDAVYPPHPTHPAADGRRKLAANIANRLRERAARNVLDCAAGTGFPALDLAAMGWDIHCTDGDPAMIAILTDQASERGLDISRLAPPRRPGIQVPDGQSPLVLNWTELERIPLRYDYVLCRGNSLAYADTWAGRTRVASDVLVATYLERIMRRVRPGGYLHVDAPWQLELPTESYRSVGGSGSIWEQVTADDTHREWTVSFKLPPSTQPTKFRRYSSLLTIDRVEVILKELGMEDTTPFEMDGERPAFGTIVARRPTQASAAPSPTTAANDRRIDVRRLLHTRDRPKFPRRRKAQRARRGSHAEFVDRYETYLDAIYEVDDDGPAASGRWRLMRSIANEMRQRRAIDVLDCAAGTGFPLVDLAADARGRFRIHCSDGDRLMIKDLMARASDLGVPLTNLSPPRRRAPNRLSASMVLDWTELDDVTHRYDYVLCRGNSLAYANTWGGKKKVADNALVEAYLTIIATKVRPGGYLHIDAPWTLDLEARNRQLGTEAIWEQVSVDRDKREWWLTFAADDGELIEFKRYSSLITIDRVKEMLDRLGFEETSPFRLDGERESFGVIIARKGEQAYRNASDSAL